MVSISDIQSLAGVDSSLNVSFSSHNQDTIDPDQLLPSDSLQTSTGIYIVIHGHFYQPPRENPYLDVIERQPSANPCHDWNERIYHECYRPNTVDRVLNDRGEVVGIINNYEYLSFNIGPTLMRWLERYYMKVYQAILEADRKSCERLNGHGNAIAQVYNHIIMPLANQRDKLTQIRWGKADFHARFDRDPEGMWLAETAIDYPTLEALIDEGICFTILAPSQALRCRPLPSENEPDPDWIEVGEGQIDPVGSRESITSGPSQLDLDVPISVHPAPDNPKKDFPSNQSRFYYSYSFLSGSCGCIGDSYDGRQVDWISSSYCGCHQRDVVRPFHLL